MDSKYDVFISYSRKDLEVVKGIKEPQMHTAGWTCKELRVVHRVLSAP